MGLGDTKDKEAMDMWQLWSLSSSLKPVCLLVQILLDLFLHTWLCRLSLHALEHGLSTAY